jgi:hypothetical protein
MAGPARRPSAASLLGCFQPARLLSNLRRRSQINGWESTRLKRWHIYSRCNPENPRASSFFLPPPAAQHRTGGGRPFFPAVGALPVAVSGAAPVQNRGRHPPFLLLPPFLHQKTVKPQATKRGDTHGGPVEEENRHCCRPPRRRARPPRG